MKLSYGAITVLIAASITGLSVGTAQAVNYVQSLAPEFSSCEGGYVALTYDDGPTPTTKPLVDALERNHMTVTFFVIGHHVTVDPAAIVYAHSKGNAIEDHTWTHPHLTAVGPGARDAEIQSTQQIIEATIGVKPTLFRPPFGDTNPEVRASVDSAGMTEVIWTRDTNDWQGPSAQQIADIVGGSNPGDIILMHDDDAIDVEAVPLIRAALQNRKMCAGMIVPDDESTLNAWEGLDFYARVVPWS